MKHKLLSAFCIFMVIAISLVTFASRAQSQNESDNQHHSTGGASHGHGSHHANGFIPVEGGHAAFAAIIEIVAQLEKDENTDWNKVDIDGLHAHLIDMDNLMRNSTVSTSVTGTTQIEFDVTGTPDSIDSIQRMVPAHSLFIQSSRGWRIESKLHSEGALLSIEVDTTATLDKLRALGFYGFMALDSHHQQHHYQMALGQPH